MWTRHYLKYLLPRGQINLMKIKFGLVSFLLPLLSLLFLSLPDLKAVGVEAALGLGQVFPWGSVAYKGANVDVKNDLKYDSVTAYFGRLKVDMPLLIPNLYFTANPLRFSGRGVKDVNFTFGGNNFTGNVALDSSLKLDHYDLALYYGVPALKTATRGKVNVDFGLNLRLIDFKAEISQPTLGVTETKKQTIPVPMGYVAFQIKPIDAVKFEGELRAVAYGANHYYDGVLRVKSMLFKFLFIAGGYKYQSFVFDRDDLRADFRFGGPIAELGVEF